VLSRRLGALAADADDRFALQPDGVVLWDGQAAGRLVPGASPFNPKVRLFGELGAEPVRERAKRRLEAFVAAEASRRLASLKRLRDSLGDGSLKGLARGLAYRLAEAGGVLERGPVAAEVAGLSQAERRALRAFGVRFGAFSLFLPALLRPEARDGLAAFAAVETPHWRPSPGEVVALPEPAPPPRVLAAYGLRRCGGLGVPVEALERLDGLLRDAPREGGGVGLSDAALAELGWSPETAARILRALDYVPVRRKTGDGPPRWRRRSTPPVPKAPVARPDSPFAALAALHAPPPAQRRRKPRRRVRKAAAP
jgi:ATP-dependent RNA helicase SUPV3L1/SUV3